ncbi:MAG: hypothetical protein TR69_WS6001000417 [candidate division WS6 bacterium OLB20]|uniref:Uncharacterized protein n=1 Tax=candidate division WS6 bacterium OLB20 TaxID=1617426 RepID=A0A136LXM6_9BACT|nr:MAG: hypothetical protein TR69_WS6001000417 [candidate division WS6 bacterium OLB20]
MEVDVDEKLGRTTPKRIYDLGVRVWNKVGDPKTGASPNLKTS